MINYSFVLQDALPLLLMTFFKKKTTKKTALLAAIWIFMAVSLTQSVCNSAPKKCDAPPARLSNVARTFVAVVNSTKLWQVVLVHACVHTIWHVSWSACWFLESPLKICASVITWLSVHQRRLKSCKSSLSLFVFWLKVLSLLQTSALEAT